MIKIKAILVIILLFTGLEAYSNQDTTKTLILQEDKRSELEKLLGKEKSGTDLERIYNLPGGDTLSRNIFTAEQDSAYYKALKTKLPNFTRFQMELKLSEAERNFIERGQSTSWDIAMRNMNVPTAYYQPSAVERTLHESNIRQSMYVPLVPTMMNSGLKMSLSSIGQFLGIIEDVSPTISYSLDYNTEVEVVVYSIQAIVVQTIFKGMQTAGSYSFTWNLRDDKGRKMPPGDYIMEVRMGTYKFVRKRTII